MVGGTVGGQCLLRVIVAGPLPILISSNKEVIAGNRKGKGEVAVVMEEVGVIPAHRCVGFLCVLFFGRCVCYTTNSIDYACFIFVVSRCGAVRDDITVLLSAPFVPFVFSFLRHVQSFFC